MKKVLRSFLPLIGLLIILTGANAQVNLSGSTYTQNFDGLVNTGTSNVLPAGWLILETGSSAAVNGNYTAGTGSGNAGDVYSFGAAASTERALGSLRSGTLTPTIGVAFTNNTGTTLTSIQVSYTGEQWRLGTTPRTVGDRMDFQYSTDATSLATGSWTGVASLNFTSPVLSGTVGAINGNTATNRTVITATITGLSIPNGNTFYFRWQDTDASGADDGLGIDDITITLPSACTAPVAQPTGFSATATLNSISGSFTDAVPAAPAYLVIISTSNTLSEQPANGTVYAIDDVVGNGTIVSISNSTSFIANDLTPSTPYFFFIFSYNTPEYCYNQVNPLTGSQSTNSPPPCTPPGTQASALSASAITGASINLNYTRGDGDNILILARTGSAINSNPVNGLAYIAGNTIGTGNTVIYNGPASTFSYTGLSQNTTYHFALYEYTTATLCYNTPALTGNFSTLCVTPVNVNALNASSGNALVNLLWTNPTATCYDEILVVASDASITGAGSDFPGAPNSLYSGSGQVVFRGIGSNVSVTGLTNGTTYYFKVFTKIGAVWSSGVQITAVPFNNLAGFNYYYGNLHAHSSYSDGNKDDLTKTPKDNYEFGRDANCMDFLGMSEHNHNTAGMVLSNYILGYNQANQVNLVPGPTGNTLVTFWGMEWGVISGGGHILVYGFDDKLIGWETGNYDIFCAKSDYASLFNLINNKPGAFATLAHPNTSDYNGAAGTYNATADDAIVSTAIESGPAFSTTLTYDNYPSSLSYLNYYRTMLAAGYRLGAQMDHDNHNFTFGRTSANRMVVLASTKTRADITAAIRSMRFYASNDCNVRINYRLNGNPMGSLLSGSGVPTITLDVNDPDGETTGTIQLWGGQVGAAAPVLPIQTFTATSNVSYGPADITNIQPDNTTYYYYFLITQTDGQRIVSSPIWYTRNDAVLPVQLTNFTGRYNSDKNLVELQWTTAQEFNNKAFYIEKSIDGGVTYRSIGMVNGNGSSTFAHSYLFNDYEVFKGLALYRLRQVDFDNKFRYSAIVPVSVKVKESNYYSVYPNPAGSFTYITANKLVRGTATIQLIDMGGRILKQTTTGFSNSTTYRLSLDGIGKGIYIVKVAAEGTVYTEKLMVQ
jgi:trimeric autotransporter adhesin